MKLFSNVRMSAGRACLFFSLLILLTTGSLLISKKLGAAAAEQSSSSKNDAALIESYRHVEVASVSDAMEQLLGKKLYMTHRMRPIFNSKFAGFALTVHLKKQENNDSAALNGMLSAIDAGTTNSVYIMQVDDGADIAGMGGLMGTAMSARGFSGAVIDGGVRDVAYLQKIGFPVFATGFVALVAFFASAEQAEIHRAARLLMVTAAVGWTIATLGTEPAAVVAVAVTLPLVGLSGRLRDHPVGEPEP